MLVDRPLERLRRRRRTQAVGRPRVAMNRPDDRAADLAARGSHHYCMEGMVESPGTVRSRRWRRPSAATASASCLELRRRSGAKPPTHAISALEHPTHRDQIVEEGEIVVVLEREPAGRSDRAGSTSCAWLNGRAATLLDADQPAFFEQLQPLAHDGPAEAELLAKGRLGRQHRARGQRAADDLLGEFFDDHRRQTRRTRRPRRREVVDPHPLHDKHQMFLAHGGMILSRQLPHRRLALSAAALWMRAARKPLPPHIRRGRSTRRWTRPGRWAFADSDTAPHYGLGLSERRLGSALARRNRDDYVLSTKVGRLLEPVDIVAGEDDEGFAVPATHRRIRDFSRDGIRRSLEESLQRLNLDRVDVVDLHDPDGHLADVLSEGFAALADLRAEGVVSAIGAGMNHSEPLATLVRETDMDLVMVAGRYTLLEQESLDDLLPLCLERGVGVVAAGVFNSGLLARPSPSMDAHYNYEDAPPSVVRRAREIARICQRHGTTLPAAAIAFPLAHPAVVSVCLGARSGEQIERTHPPAPSGLNRSLARA